MKKWTIDPDHSVASFIVRHMMIANVRGQFNKLVGTIHFDPDDILHSTVEATIDVTGVYTGISKRDGHLRSADFFDVSNHPKITFKSTKVESTGGNHLKITGDLTIRGTTRKVVLEAEFLGPLKSPFDEDISLGFSAMTTINRKDFGVSWNETWEGGGMVAGWDVNIAIDAEADLEAN